VATLTAALALCCAGPAAAATVAPSTAVLGADDVAGLTVGPASAAPWVGLVSRRAATGSRAAATVLRSSGNPRLLIVSRALVAPDVAHANGSAADRVDARALGVPTSALRRAQRSVWRDGPVVGELVTLGAAKGDALVARLRDTLRTRARRTVARTAWDGLLARAAARGGRPDAATALQAFALAVAPLPGVRVPKGPRGSIPEGTLATSWVLANYGRLTPGVRQAVDRVLRRAFGLSGRAGAAGAQLDAVKAKAIAFVSQRAGVELTLPVTIVRGYPSSASGAAALGVDASGSYRSTKPAARCVISVRRGGVSKTVIAHEVFHCLQIQLTGSASGLQALDGDRAWLGEGSASYAGCLFSQDGAAPYRKAYAGYLEQPLTALGRRTYDAIGFFAHLDQSGAGALASVRRAIATPSMAVAYPAVANEGGSDIFGSWASSLYRTPARGSAWDVSGPCAPPRSRAAEPTPIVLAGSGRITLTAPAYAAHPYELFAGHTTAGAITVHRASGHVRVGSSGLDDQPTGDAVYCMSGGSAGSNPAIALTGGPDGAKVTIAAADATQACGPGGTATCRTQLCLPFSGNSSGPPGSGGSGPLSPTVNPGNRIPEENAKQGTPIAQWDLSGSSFPAGDPELQGFTTDISYNVGQTVQFKVSSNLAYRMDIYRMGYYGGDGARLVGSVENRPANDQQSNPGCMTDSTTGLVDCGGWSVSATWPIPADAVSGVYFAKLINTDGGASHVFFVVRDDSSHSDIYYQTSDTTWQAYNNYGDESLYAGGPLFGGSTPRAAKVSYNRPFVTRRVDQGQDWVFNAEYPMIRWLERNGYDVSYESGVDTDRYGASLIPNHRVFMSSGHDEYWSGQQRANVEAARAAGVNLTFFSGNEVFWKTRWENNHRTLVSYKETHENAHIDPSGQWTGTYRDSRPINPEGAHPENALTGTIFKVNAGTKAIQVPNSYHDMPFWRDTNVGTVLPQGTLGYEWDTTDDIANGAQPPGLVRLSSSSYTAADGLTVLTDNGSTYASGSATHSLTLYRASSGALVFGAGTVQWAWGLDAEHDRDAALVSRPMQQATLNLLADMHVQPGTRQLDLTAESAVANPLAPMP
jgi:N,N-dimethylformamidase beta subunit-like protein